MLVFELILTLSSGQRLQHRGMSQFADGGIRTKTYAASANYINKMSNYCSGCFYDKKEKVGEKGVSNSLYWHFHVRNRFEKIHASEMVLPDAR
jgi:deoxyribodipyrimidine photolyase-like uncharacterized protein